MFSGGSELGAGPNKTVSLAPLQLLQLEELPHATSRSLPSQPDPHAAGAWCPCVFPGGCAEWCQEDIWCSVSALPQADWSYFIRFPSLNLSPVISHLKLRILEGRDVSVTCCTAPSCQGPAGFMCFCSTEHKKHFALRTFARFFLLCAWFLNQQTQKPIWRSHWCTKSILCQN